MRSRRWTRLRRRRFSVATRSMAKLCSSPGSSWKRARSRPGCFRRGRARRWSRRRPRPRPRPRPHRHPRRRSKHPGTRVTGPASSRGSFGRWRCRASTRSPRRPLPCLLSPTRARSLLLRLRHCLQRRVRRPHPLGPVRKASPIRKARPRAPASSRACSGRFSRPNRSLRRRPRPLRRRPPPRVRRPPPLWILRHRPHLQALHRRAAVELREPSPARVPSLSSSERSLAREKGGGRNRRPVRSRLARRRRRRRRRLPHLPGLRPRLRCRLARRLRRPVHRIPSRRRRLPPRLRPMAVACTMDRAGRADRAGVPRPPMITSSGSAGLVHPPQVPAGEHMALPQEAPGCVRDPRLLRDPRPLRRPGALRPPRCPVGREAGPSRRWVAPDRGNSLASSRPCRRGWALCPLPGHRIRGR